MEAQATSPSPRSPREDTHTQDAAKQKAHEPGQGTHMYRIGGVSQGAPVHKLRPNNGDGGDDDSSSFLGRSPSLMA